MSKRVRDLNQQELDLFNEVEELLSNKFYIPANITPEELEEMKKVDESLGINNEEEYKKHLVTETIPMEPLHPKVVEYILEKMYEMFEINQQKKLGK